MPVSDLFERARAERPDHPAVVDGDGTLTYAELGADVDRAAGWLRAQGVAPGQRVVHAGGNDRTFLALFHATLRIGAVFVPVHPDLTDLQVAGIVEDCSAALAICPPGAGSGPAGPSRSGRPGGRSGTPPPTASPPGSRTTASRC